MKLAKPIHSDIKRDDMILNMILLWNSIEDCEAVLDESQSFNDPY